MKINNRRFCRLILYVGVLIPIIVFIIVIGFAWIFNSQLIYPGCPNPIPINGLQRPEEHWLETKDGYSIRIWYYPTKNHAAIINLGGQTGSLGDQPFPTEKLIQNGFGLVQVDTRACASPAAPVTLGGNELFDAEAALLFLKENDNVDKARIGVLGFSLGGATAIRLAALHPEIQAVVRDGGFSNLGELLNPSTKKSLVLEVFQTTSVALYQISTGIDPWKVSPIDDINLISPRPILLIYGETEANYGVEQYNAAKEPKTLWIVPGGSHGMNYFASADEYEERLITFFSKTLLKE